MGAAASSVIGTHMTKYITVASQLSFEFGRRHVVSISVHELQPNFNEMRRPARKVGYVARDGLPRSSVRDSGLGSMTSTTNTQHRRHLHRGFFRDPRQTEVAIIGIRMPHSSAKDQYLTSSCRGLEIDSSLMLSVKFDRLLLETRSIHPSHCACGPRA